LSDLFAYMYCTSYSLYDQAACEWLTPYPLLMHARRDSCKYPSCLNPSDDFKEDKVRLGL
jgi:hypothetical protein